MGPNSENAPGPSFDELLTPEGRQFAMEHGLDDVSFEKIDDQISDNNGEPNDSSEL